MELRLKTGELVADKRADDGGIPPDVLVAVVGQLNGGSRLIKVGVDLGQEVGRNNCVAVGSSRFIRARRPGCEHQTIFVIGREAEATTFVTVVIVLRTGHELIDAYFGQARPAEPHDEELLRMDPKGLAGAKDEALAFWRGHGRILGSCDVRCTTPSCGALIVRGDVLTFFNKSEILCRSCQAAAAGGGYDW